MEITTWTDEEREEYWNGGLMWWEQYVDVFESNKIIRS